MIEGNRSRVLIIGAGFGGIGMGARLKQAGVNDFIILERAAGPGGVWQANHYPGAACDVESHLYSFSFATNFDWSSSHGTRDEILAYFDHCIARFGLRKHIRYGVSVEAARFDAEADLWRVNLSTGEELAATALVSACGLFNTPAIPKIAGADTFAGKQFHSADWDPAFDPSGLRIAVIGTGCSAAQFIPEIAPAAERVTVFQRTPAFVGPRANRPYSASKRTILRAFPILRRLDRLRIFWRYEQSCQVQIDAALQATRLAGARAFVGREVNDPAKREKLMPTTQAGCKRNVRSTAYLKALDREDVDLVTDRIQRITPGGIETADGILHEADAILYGTGFSASEYLSTFKLVGPDGVELRKHWGDDPQAYLGVTVSGCPNFFMLYGPNTNTPGSIVFVLECQIDYILQCLKRMQREKKTRFEVREEVQARYNEGLQARLGSTSWASSCISYFKNRSGRIVTQFPDSSSRYRRLLRHLRGSDFRLE